MRTIYIPWPAEVNHLGHANGQGGHHHGRAQRWLHANRVGQTHHRHQMEIVHSNTVGAPLARLSHRSKIYVKGHGGPGLHSIASCQTGAAVFLRYDEVCRRLIRSGLRRSWSGELVFESCFSGRGRPGSQGFAYKAAQYLRKRGYLLLRPFGYLGSVSSWPNNAGRTPGRHDYAHRWVDLGGKQVKSKYAKIPV